MSGSGSSGPGVVERASKEISKRIHLLGFSKTSSAKRNAAKTAALGQEDQPQSKQSVPEDQQKATTEADKLNGNESPPTENVAVTASSGASTQSSVSKMGTIIRGSVMDKVTHVFNSSTMGNTSNKEQQQSQATASSLSGGNAPCSTTSLTSSGINIPKGMKEYMEEYN